MKIEEAKLEALRQEQVAQAAPQVVPAEGQPAGWGHVLAQANAGGSQEEEEAGEEEERLQKKEGDQQSEI